MLKKYILFLILFLGLTLEGYSQVYDIPYLLIDNTKTPWGHKFFRTFSEIWKPPIGIEGYYITIGEDKISFKQSWVYVSVGDNIYNYRVFYSLLKPTMSDLDMQRKALAAAKRALTFLLKDYLRLKSYEQF
ncbi:CsgE family curli-type amyloid fiber assembly protein [Thermovibrio sp.]